MKSYLTMVKRMTNYERIKKMTVPELARLIGSIHSDFDEHIRTINGDNVFDSFDDIEEWLERECGKDVSNHLN